MVTNGIESTTNEAGITTIEFGSEKANSLDSSMLAALRDAIVSAGRSDSTKVIVLRGAGEKTFCSGASFEEMKALKDAESAKRFFLGFGEVILAMIRCPKIIISRVQGKVVGGGVGIVCASDYAIASTNALARLSELAIGLGPYVIGAVVERRIGPGAFSAMSLDSDWRDAIWCFQNNLFAQVFEAELDENVEHYATQFANYDVKAAQQWKSLLWRGTEGWDALFAERAEQVGALALAKEWPEPAPLPTEIPVP